MFIKMFENPDMAKHLTAVMSSAMFEIVMYIVAVVQTHMKPEAVEHNNAIMTVRYLLCEIFCLC